MKQVFNKVLKFLSRFFLSLRIHLHVGICNEDDANKESEGHAEIQSDDPEVKEEQKGIL